jgi:hypothetical protein
LGQRSRRVWIYPKSSWVGPKLAIANPELISTDAPRIVSEDPTKVTDSFGFLLIAHCCIPRIFTFLLRRSLPQGPVAWSLGVPSI